MAVLAASGAFRWLTGGESFAVCLCWFRYRIERLPG